MPLPLNDAKEELNDKAHLEGNLLKIVDMIAGDHLIKYKLLLSYDGNELQVEKVSEFPPDIGYERNASVIPDAENDITKTWADGPSAIYIRQKINELQELLGIE
jgi:hypothetical protein